ncbi:ankyrin repeat domain-containing protein [Pseudomonas sp. CBSPCAW29]|nr:ankyrin repeat domain-containing protein [Pseudomonas sp. CBSPCAW29]
MSDQAKQMTEDEAAEFAEQVFDVARKGDAAMLAALLAKGLPPNLRNHNGDTLLMLSAYHGHVDAVKVLLEFKADPQIANDKNQLPIAGAAFKGNLPVVKALIEGGALVEGASSSDGRTALMMAAMFNRTEMVDYLISQGANPKATDAQGVTALAAAQTMGAVDTAAQLQKLV